MKSKLLIIAAGALALGVIAFAATSASESLETSVRNVFKALDAGDKATGLMYGPSGTSKFPVSAFDYDWDNKPVVCEGAEAVNKFLAGVFDDMAKRTMKVKSVVSNVRTGSNSPELGFATFDVMQTMTAGGKSETAKFRYTGVFSQDARTGKWRFVHWHGTLLSAEPSGSK